MAAKDDLGRYGESLAARYLVEHGATVLERNWRCARGEIDIVACEGSTLLFCEVKTRSSAGFGDPSEAVGWHKSSRLRRLAAQWLADNDGRWSQIRFDVVAILKQPGRPAQLRHLRGAF